MRTTYLVTATSKTTCTADDYATLAGTFLNELTTAFADKAEMFSSEADELAADIEISYDNVLKAQIALDYEGSLAVTVDKAKLTKLLKEECGRPLKIEKQRLELN